MNLQPLKHNIFTILCTATSVLCLSASYAQVHTPVIVGNKYPMLTSEQFSQGHFAQASQTARAYLDLSQQKVALDNPANHDMAKFDIAIAGLKSDISGSEDYAKKVKSETLNPTYTQRLAFSLAQYYFRQDKFADAIAYYEEAGIDNLDNNEIGDQKFELAYCYFNNHQLDKAKALFSVIKEITDSKYYMASNYYFGLLCYNEKKYAEALKSFDIIKDEREYRLVVPYYIAEIYYFKGDKERALSLSDTLIKAKERSFYHKELHLLVAQCYFENEKYAEAKPYFEYFYKQTDKIGKEELYKMSYCYYRLGEWKNAIEKFRMLSDAKDSLGQTAMYLLGDCYLKTYDKTSARNAFGICADMGFNKGQQEAAMILYARLSYETGNRDEALRQLNMLMTMFPSSQYKDETQALVSDLLIKTNSFQEALDHLQQVKVKDNEYWTLYQKATYGYAVQKFREGDLNAADDYFGMSLKNPVNAEYERVAYFWRGEIAYLQHRYQDAINYSQNFISRNGDMAIIERLSPQATIQHAYLNMGYSALETDNYVAAQDFFNQAQQARANSDKHSASVAMLLEADAVFLQKNYTKAVTLYEKIIAAGGNDAEYAKYQKAILLGLLNKSNEKIALLESLIKATPPSVYANNARYEIALTYLEMDKYQAALTALKQLTDNTADNSLKPKAWMKTGFVYQQQNDIPKAIEAYKKVVISYPAAEERAAALETLKSLYIQSNKPGLYTQLLKESDLPIAENSDLDSTYYAAGEAQFAASKWESAREGFTSYLKQYPNGVFAVKAHYYLAESNYKLKKYAEARDEYNLVLATPWNDFSESSARRCAAIAMELKDYETAYKHYNSLRNNVTDKFSSEIIYRGLMKSSFYTERYTEAGLYADSLLALPGISTESATDGKLYKARTLQLADKYEEAIVAFQQMPSNKNGEAAAESRYRIAEILFKQNKLKEAEEAVNDAIKLSAGYDKWVGKDYLLLADILVKQNDFFNAKALLQSIVKNTKIEELKQEAIQKLDEVKKLEKRQSKLSEE